MPGLGSGSTTWETISIETISCAIHFILNLPYTCSFFILLVHLKLNILEPLRNPSITYVNMVL